MTTVNDICGAMAKLAPPETAQSYDNTGLLIGWRGAAVTRVLAALDVTDAVIDEAVSLGVDMIVAHHPLIRLNGALSKVTDETRTGNAVLRLIENRIAVYAAHTDLDSADGGVNEVLARKLCLNNIAPIVLEYGERPLIGRTGGLDTPATLSEFAVFTAKMLGLPMVKYVGEGNTQVSRVAVCGGSGADKGSFGAAVKNGCNVYVTGDVTYHKAHAAAELNLGLIDAGHFATEILIAEKLKDYIHTETGVAAHVASVEKDIFSVVGKLIK